MKAHFPQHKLVIRLFKSLPSILPSMVYLAVASMRCILGADDDSPLYQQCGNPVIPSFMVNVLLFSVWALSFVVGPLMKKGGGGGGGGDDDDDSEADDSRKVFGSWYVVHPAAVGKKSQTQNFNPVEYDDHFHHPAAFQYYRLPEEITKEEAAKVDPMAVVKAHPSHAPWLKTSTDDEVKVVKSMDEMSEINYGKVKKGLKVLVTSGKTAELINEQNCSLESRQSRTHKVEVEFQGKDKNYYHSLSTTGSSTLNIPFDESNFALPSSASTLVGR